MWSIAMGTVSDRAPSDSEERTGFVAVEGRLPCGGGSSLGGRRRAGLAAGLTGLLVLAAVWTRSPPQCPLEGSAGIGAGVGLDLEVATASGAHATDNRARAIVSVLNDKSADEAKGLVQKAMKHAGSETLARRRKLQSFSDVLKDSEGRCDIVLADPPAYLGHDGESKLTLSDSGGALQSWRIKKADGLNVFSIEAFRAPTDTDRFSFLAHPGGTEVGFAGAPFKKWRIVARNPTVNVSDRVYTVEAVGSGGSGFLNQIGKGVKLAAGGEGADPLQTWKIPCLAQLSRIQQTRKAICAVNVIYAVQYLSRASLNIQGAAKTCPNSRGLISKICGLNSLVIVFSFSNLALSISDAASSCAETTSAQALCASAVEALVASLSAVGAGGIVVAAGCDPTLTPDQLGLPAGATPANLQGPPPAGRRLFLGGGKTNVMAQCVLDATQVAWSLGSVALAITAAYRDGCPGIGLGSVLGELHRSACAMDIGSVLYAFGRIAVFISVAFIHCTDELNLQALCSTGVSALIAAAAALVVTGNAFYIACDQGLKVVGKGGLIPPEIGVAAEAGATRRLAGMALTGVGAGSERMRQTVRSLGYNISDLLRLPSFDNINSALDVLQSFDEAQVESLGLGQADLEKRFRRPEDLWQHVGINISDDKAVPPPPARRPVRERFVELMEQVMSKEDLERVAAASAPQVSQKWQWPLSMNRCP